MKSYIIKQKLVKKNEILRNEYSFSGFSYRFVESKNKNYFLLGSDEILDKNVKGFEPGSKEYIDFSENYFVRISEMDNLNFTFTTSKDTKKIRPVENSNKSKIINQGDICYQTASNVGNVCIYDGKKAFYNSHIRKLAFKKNKYYIFAILKSVFGKEQVDVSGSIKGVDNFREEYLLNTKIPFPNTTNHPNPENVETFVSLIVQNIIDKEEQIKIKNKQIDELIEKELKENQKRENFSYKYPRISEIKEETRLDTGLYDRGFKQIDFLIRNYEGGYEYLKDLKTNFKSGETPKTYLENENGKYIWVSNKDFRNNIWKNFTKINTLNVKNLVPKNAILFSRRAPAGINQIIVEKQSMIVNDGIKIITIDKINTEKLIFISLFFNSSVYQNILRQLSGGGVFGGMTNEDILNMYFPNFPESKQQEITNLYYNPLEKNNNLNLENYLEKEQSRNREVGIFQLNMEIFELREQLEDLVHKIIMEEKIEILI